jgi:hypothetical protein
MISANGACWSHFDAIQNGNFGAFDLLKGEYV